MDLKTRWILKGCARCQGDLALEFIDHIWSWNCLACGREYSLEFIRELVVRKDGEDGPVRDGND